MSNGDAPVTTGAANDPELTRLMAGLPGMVYRAAPQLPFAFEIVGGDYERILGRSLDELTAKPDIRSTFMYPDDVARYRAAVENALKCGDTFQIEYSVIYPDTTERVVWGQGGPVRAPDGSCFIEGSIIDIEGPVHARQVQDATYRISQAASAESLQELYGQTHDIIGELMPSENLYFALRDPKTGFITYPYYIDEYNVVPPDPRTAETGLTACVLRTGTPLLLSEFSESDPVRSGNVTPTGTPTISWLGVPLQLKRSTIGVIAVQVYHGSYRYTEQDRNILSFVADQVAVSIDRWCSHDALATSEERFRIAAQSTSDIVYEWHTVKDRYAYYGDVDGDLARAIGGLPSKGSQWNLYVHPDDLPVLQQAIQEHLRTNMPCRVVYRMRCTDGTWRTVVDSSQVVLDKDGNVVTRIGTDTDITDRVAAESSLRESEARMRALFAAMNDFIVIMDCNGRCIEWVSTGASQQYSPDSLVGRSGRDAFAPEAAKAVLAQVRRALSEHATTESGFSHDIAGSRHWFEVRISPLADERVLLVAHDPTARHASQEAVRIEASKAESYFNTSGVIREVIDTDLRLVRLNQKGYEFFGYAPDEIVSKDWFDIKLPEREGDKVKASIRSELVGQPLPRHAEGPVVTRSGEERIVAWHDSLLRDPAGRVTGLISSGVDVTDRVRAERALQASELKFKELFNQAQDAILLHVINADETIGPFIEANDVACQWVGYTREELQHMNVTDIVVASTPDTLEQTGQQLREHGKTTFAVELKARDGHRLPAEVSASVFALEGRTVVLSIVRDITDRLHLESELQRMDKLESLGVLAGDIAHDFNNMLTGIVGNINLARIEDDTNHSRELLEEAQREILQTRGLTQQLLAFAKGGGPSVPSRTLLTSCGKPSASFCAVLTFRLVSTCPRICGGQTSTGCWMPSCQTTKPTSLRASSRNHMTWKGLQRLSPGSAPLE